jgi:DNA-binding transcriptional LysR family regulator
MDYRDQVFMAVAENLSFSKAAKLLYISQPAVTKHIQEMENKAEIALFTRKGNLVSLTAAGELMYNHLRKIYNSYNELNYEISMLKGECEGNLRIGASSTIAQYLLPKLLAAFRKRYPKIGISMVSGNSLQMEKMLTANNIDLALVENSSGAQDLRYTPFSEDHILPVTGTNSLYAKKGSLTVPDLSVIPLVLREQGSGTLQIILKEFSSAGIDTEHLNVIIRLGATEAIKNFLTEYDGVAFISERALEKELQLKLLKPLAIKHFSITRYFRVAQRQEPQLHPQQLLSQFLSSYNF